MSLSHLIYYVDFLKEVVELLSIYINCFVSIRFSNATAFQILRSLENIPRSIPTVCPLVPLHFHLIANLNSSEFRHSSCVQIVIAVDLACRTVLD